MKSASEIVMHYWPKWMLNTPICGKNRNTRNFDYSADRTEVTCSRCLDLISKMEEEDENR